MAIKRTQTTQDIANLLDLDPTTVQNWVKQGCPCDKSTKSKQPHRFNEGEVLAWMKSRGLSGKVGRPNEVLGDDLKALKIRKEAALCEKYERENKVEAGELIDAAEEQQRDIAKIVTVRNRLCGLGATLSPQLEGLDGPERQSLIDDAIENILKEFGS